MVNKKRLDGRWIQLYTNRIKLLPILGRFNISHADRWQQCGNRPDFREVDFQTRDVFTKRVGSLAVDLPGVADINLLRRKGLCLATENEVLKSQRYDAVQKSIICKSQRDAIKLPRITSTATASSATPSGFMRWSQQSIMVFDHRRRSSVLQQLESQKRHVAQRHLERKIMKSREYYYRNRTRNSVPNIDGVIRKFVAEALDDRHREMLSILELPGEESMGKDPRTSVFQEWKKSAIDILDKQAEDDLKMVAGYKRIIRRPTVVKLKRAHFRPAPKSQVDENTRCSVLAEVLWDEDDEDDSVRAPSVDDLLELEQRKDREKVASRSIEKVASRSSEKVASRSSEKVASRSSEKVGFRSREASPPAIMFKLTRPRSDPRTSDGDD